MDKSIGLIGTLIISIFDILCLGKLQKQKINYKDINIYSAILILTILLFLNYYYIPVILRILMVPLLFSFINRFLYKKDLYKSLLVGIVLELISIIIELLILIFLTLLFGNELNGIVLKIFGNSIISNLVIGLIMFYVSSRKIIVDKCNKLIVFLTEISKYKITFFSIIILISVNFVFTIYYKNTILNDIYFLLITVFIAISYITIIVFTLLSENKYKKTLKKFDLTMQSLKQYEEILDKYKVINHENKNQLLIIRNMLKNNENPSEYLGTLLKNKVNDDEKLMLESSIIPSGGLRAVVYAKLLKIKDYKIDYNLEIDKGVRNYDMNQLDNDTLMDIYNIINIFLDNAIEESMNNNEKEIFIEMYLDNNIIINISNVIEREIDLSLIKKAGYTSKSKGHGYGLSLVEKIINQNSKLENITNIEEDLFVQTLIIKTK